MPLRWHRTDNPYRVNSFGILQLGRQVEPRVIAATRQKIVMKIRSGMPHVVAGREVPENEVLEAEASLYEPAEFAHEQLLVHSVPSDEGSRIRQLCTSIVEDSMPVRSGRVLHITNVAALAPLAPHPVPADLPWPQWAELGVPGPDCAADRRGDVQFDL